MQSFPLLPACPCLVMCSETFPLPPPPHKGTHFYSCNKNALCWLFSAPCPGGSSLAFVCRSAQWELGSGGAVGVVLCQADEMLWVLCWAHGCCECCTRVHAMFVGCCGCHAGITGCCGCCAGLLGCCGCHTRVPCQVYGVQYMYQGSMVGSCGAVLGSPSAMAAGRALLLAVLVCFGVRLWCLALGAPSGAQGSLGSVGR